MIRLRYSYTVRLVRRTAVHSTRVSGVINSVTQVETKRATSLAISSLHEELYKGNSGRSFAAQLPTTRAIRTQLPFYPIARASSWRRPFPSRERNFFPRVPTMGTENAFLFFASLAARVPRFLFDDIFFLFDQRV